MKKVFIFILGIFLYTSALAGSSAFSNVNVLGIRIDTSGYGIVTFSAPPVTPGPSCIVAFYANSIAFNSNTAGGKSFLTAMLAAKMAGTTVSVWGLGTCTIYGSSVEDFSSSSNN